MSNRHRDPFADVGVGDGHRTPTAPRDPFEGVGAGVGPGRPTSGEVLRSNHDGGCGCDRQPVSRPDSGQFVWPPYDDQKAIPKDQKVPHWTPEEWTPWDQAKMDRIVDAGNRFEGDVPTGIENWLAEQAKSSMEFAHTLVAGECVWEAFDRFKSLPSPPVEVLFPPVQQLLVAATAVLRNPAVPEYKSEEYYTTSDGLPAVEFETTSSQNVENVTGNPASLAKSLATCDYPFDPGVQAGIVARPAEAKSALYQNPWGEPDLADFAVVVEDIPCYLVDVDLADKALQKGLNPMWQRRFYAVETGSSDASLSQCWAALYNWWAVTLAAPEFTGLPTEELKSNYLDQLVPGDLARWLCKYECDPDRDFSVSYLGFDHWMNVAFYALYNLFWDFHFMSSGSDEVYVGVEELLDDTFNRITVDPMGAVDIEDVFDKLGPPDVGGTHCKEENKDFLAMLGQLPPKTVKEKPGAVNECADDSDCSGTGLVELRVYRLQTGFPSNESNYDGTAAIGLVEEATLKVVIGSSAPERSKAQTCVWTYFWACRKAYEKVLVNDDCSKDHREKMVRSWLDKRRSAGKLAWLPQAPNATMKFY